MAENTSVTYRLQPPKISDFRGTILFRFIWKQSNGLQRSHIMAPWMSLRKCQPEQTQSQSLADSFDSRNGWWQLTPRPAGFGVTSCWGHIRDAEPDTFMAPAPSDSARGTCYYKQAKGPPVRPGSLGTPAFVTPSSYGPPILDKQGPRVRDQGRPFLPPHVFDGVAPVGQESFEFWLKVLWTGNEKLSWSRASDIIHAAAET